MSNPLVAQQEENPDGPGPLTQGTGDAGWATGIGIAESVNDISNLEDGSSWVESGLAYGGAALEVVSLAVDPIGTLGSYGLSWLMEHVEPLNEALDWFAGDPDGVEAYGKTWANVSAATKEAAEHYARAVEADTADWVGQAGDAYRRHARENAEAINGAAELAGTISSVVTIMGEVVSFVRELVRDLVSECIAKLITYALEAIGTLGFGTPVVAVQATAFVSKTVTRIAEVAQKLIKTISNVSPKLGKMIEVFGTIIKKFGDMPDAFAEGAWKKFDDVFGTDVVGQHNTRFGGPDGAGPGGAPDSGDTSSPDGADASNAPDAEDSGPTGSNDRPTASAEPDGPGARPDDSGAEVPEGSRTDPAQRPAPPRGPDESSGLSPGPNESTAVPDPNGRTDSPSPGIRSDETPSTSPNSAGSRTPDEGTAVSTAQDSSPGDSRTDPEDAPQVPRSPEDAPQVPHSPDDVPAGPRDEPQHAAAGSGPPDGSGGASPGPASEAPAPSTSPDEPSSTTAADVSTPTPPAPAAPQAPGTNTPSSSAAPSGPMGGVAGNPGTTGGTSSTTTPRSPDRPSGGGWTGTAGTPGAAARPASTTDAPQTARPRGPESPPRTPVESPRANGPRTEQPRPDSVETHGERPPHHPRETGGAPADDAPDQPRDAEPSTPERRAQIEEAEATRQQTPAGSSYHDNPALNEHAQRVRDDGVHHTLDVHALPEGRFRIGDRTFSAEEVADMLRNDPGWDGRPIRLLSCDAGNSGLAAELADELGVPVTAPRGLVWTDSGGRVFASDIGPDGRPIWPPDGAWDTYEPGGTTAEASNDGFHPSRGGEGPGHAPDDAEARGKDLPSQRDIDWEEPHFDRTEGRTAPTNDRSDLLEQQAAHDRDPKKNPPPELQPNTRYRVVDDPAPAQRSPRETYLYSNDATPPRITHVDAAVPNTEVPRPTAAPNNLEQVIGNPDVNYLAPDIDYRVSTGEGFFTFRTDGEGRALFDLDDFDAPPTRSDVPDIDDSGADPNPGDSPRADDAQAEATPKTIDDWSLFDANGGATPFSYRTPEENQANTAYNVYTRDGAGNEQWHGDFYTDENGDFTHVRTWSGAGTHDLNPELGDYDTMRDPTNAPGEGLPLTGVKYEITNDGSLFHTDVDGNSAVSFGTDYSGEPNQPRGDSRVQTKTGRIGTYIEYPSRPDVEYRGGHGRDHANEPTPPQERINITPHIREQNDAVGDRNNWRQMEMNREGLSKQSGHQAEHDVRVWYDQNPNGGMVPVRTQVFWEQTASGVRTAHYRSFVNVPSPAPAAERPTERRSSP